MKSSQKNEIISEHYRKMAKARKDNNRGFNDPEVIKRALETRRKNREKKANSSETKEKS